MTARKKKTRAASRLNRNRAKRLTKTQIRDRRRRIERVIREMVGKPGNPRNRRRGQKRQVMIIFLPPTKAQRAFNAEDPKTTAVKRTGRRSKRQ